MGQIQGQLQDPCGRFPADLRLSVGQDAVQEMFQLQPKGFFSGDRNRFTDDLLSGKRTDDGRATAAEEFVEEGTFRSCVRGQAVDVSALGLVIEGDVTGMRGTAEDADFPHSFGAHAAGRKVGHAPVGEVESGIGDVFGIAQDRYTNGLGRDQRVGNKTEDQIQIVDHKVEDDPDVGTAMGVRGEAMDFDESGIGSGFPQIAIDWIKTFYMPDLKDSILSRSQFYELFSQVMVCG